jgi:2-dehydro-3-deoxyphosphooctonate aldolase (KDO 8-P synthase)
MVETMAVSAIAAGATGLFIEVHPEPHKSGSDAGSILQIDRLKPILEKCIRIKNCM